MNTIQKATIIPFDPRYAKDFARLNVEWLEKYFVVEPLDKELLEQCEETIINKGGYIFFAKVGDEIAGTFSLIQIEDAVYELGKMAVSPRFQGQKIGQQLLKFCIDFAKKQGWKKVILYSNRILENAIYIYSKLGFVEIPIEENPLYKRSNIKMELVL
ncbi:GNAT family N-acetyltransferase [Aquimarina sp. 2304DJ70-9]|uniref:GNAT family N-acetyltransferase n=1 Tax=Aquimarina penaris TaxID=3231044 RepID=UPI0034620508